MIDFSTTPHVDYLNTFNNKTEVTIIDVHLLAHVNRQPKLREVTEKEKKYDVNN